MARRRASADSQPPLGLKIEKPGRLADQLYGQIVERIVDGALGEGDKLPSENELCRAYDVSRPVVREALMRLQADGLVYSRQGVGSFIKRRPPLTLIQLADPSDVAGVLRCFEARMPLEGAAARLAAQRHSGSDLEALGAALAGLERAMEGKGSAESADFEFHMAVARAAGNDFFVAILDSMHQAIDSLMRVSLGITRRGSRERIERVWDEHEAIHEAIAARDPEGADLAMRYHLHRARQRMTDHARDR